MSDTDLDALFPNNEITIGDKTYAVRPFKFGALPKVSAIIARWASEIDLENLDALKARAHVLITKFYEDALVLIELSAGVQQHEVEAMDLDAGLELFARVIEVNLDFFVKRLAPMLQRVLALKSSLGGAPSSD